jgi:chemotaxis family two-component system response regulator Rcp1
VQRYMVPGPANFAGRPEACPVGKIQYDLNKANVFKCLQKPVNSAAKMHLKWRMIFSERLNPLKILVVEDCPSDVWLIKEALKQATISIQVIVAEDGVAALDYMRLVSEGKAVRPDLILLDLNLPRKNGREVLGELKSSPFHRHTPVLVMSSSQAEDDIRECYRLNANCYITKPSNLDNYFEVVRSIEEFWFMVAQLPTRTAA